MDNIPEALHSHFYRQHAELLCHSFQAVTGESLITGDSEGTETIEQLFRASYALVSHGTEEEPVFNFGNKTALTLFECQWQDFIRLPSRKSAEQVHREERQRLLREVTEHGFISNYSGVRISSTGQRFLIKEATVWNLIDHQGVYCGQAALFPHWQRL